MSIYLLINNKSNNHKRRFFFDLESFEVFASHTTKYRTLSEILAKRLAQRASSKAHLRIIDIGCGPGQLIVPFLTYFQKLLSDLPSIEYVGVDFEDRALTRLRAKLFDFEISRHSVSLIHNRVENAITKRQLIGQFDFILCSHMLYYVPRWRWLTRQLHSLLASHGEICFILTASFETLDILREIAETNGVSWYETEPKSSTFLNWLRSSGFIFSVETHRSILSVTSCAKDDKLLATDHLAKCFSFLSGNGNYMLLYNAAHHFLELECTEFPLVESLIWVRK